MCHILHLQPPLVAIDNKNNGTVMGFQALKCRYSKGSKNGPVTGPYGPVNFYLYSS